MRGWNQASIIAFIGLAAVTVAVGQPPGPFGKGKGGPDISYTTLFQNPQVRAALNVSDEQLAKLPAASLKALAEVLNNQQLERLRGIYLQQKGNAALLEADVKGELKITGAQTKAIQAALDAQAKGQQEMFEAGGFDPEKMQELQKSTAAKIQEALTADQKTAWTKLLGQPFQIGPKGGFGGFGGGKGKGPVTRVSWPKDRKVPELPKPGADGFITLFNGKDLTNWEGLEGYWSVKDGVITGSETVENSKQTFLVLSASWAQPEKFGDFEMHFQYKFATPGGNSGLQFRSWVFNDKLYGVGGYQADFDANGQFDGGIFDEGGVAGNRGIMANRGERTIWSADNKRVNEPLPASKKELAKLVKRGDWNAMILTAKGNHVTINVNGQLMGELIDNSPKALKDGVIALQMHAGHTMTIQMKDVKIKLFNP
jgi:hypothetical protein